MGVGETYGADPQLLAAELLHIIADGIRNAPRTLQEELGPSEIGDPCLRRIGHKLLGTPTRPTPVNFKAFVGSGVHAQLAPIFDAHNLWTDAQNDHAGIERWLIETRVKVGQANGHWIWGTADLFDRITGTVIDWKTHGPWMLNHYRKEGPGDTYRRQLHLYGQGMINAGETVKDVMIIHLPRQGELSDAVVWTEPFNPGLVAETLERYGLVRELVDLAGPAALETLPMFPAWCSRCPWFVDHEVPAEQGCPGHPDARPPAATEPALRLVP